MDDVKQIEESKQKPYGIIYFVLNKINGKCYVGQTISSMRNRWSSHICASKKKGTRVHFLNALHKYGSKNFEIRTLLECYDQDTLNSAEVFFISLFDATNHKIGYNEKKGGDSGGAFSKETLEKISGKNSYCWVKVPEETQKEICQEYLSGESTLVLSKKYSLGNKIIKKVLKMNSISLRTIHVLVPDEEIIRRYSEGVSTKQLAKDYKVDQSTIYTRLRRAGIERRSKEQSIKLWRVSHLPEEEICKEYDYNSLETLGNRYKVSSSVIRRILKEHNIPLHNHSFRSVSNTGS